MSENNNGNINPQQSNIQIPNSGPSIEPPQYHQQVYLSEEQRLNKYMANPKFATARDFMASPLILIYACLTTAIWVSDLIIGLYLLLGKEYSVENVVSYIHPMYFLLSIAGFITYVSGKKARDNNLLPKTNGLGIARGISLVMLVLNALLVGFIVLVFGISTLSTIKTFGLGSRESIGMIIVLVVLIVILLVLIKYYYLQANNVFFIRSCLTGEECHCKVSVFPSVLLIFASLLSSAVLFINYSGLLQEMQFYKDYLNYLKDSVADILGEDIAEQYYDMLLSSTSPIPVWIMIALAVISILLNIVTAVIYIKATRNLNQFADTYC